MARTADPQAKGALVAAARAAFLRAGIKSARIEDITHACGLSKGAFYLHFASKEALFQELVTGLMTGLGVLLVERDEGVKAFVSKHPLTTRDTRLRAQRVTALQELERRFDLQVLRHFWEERDIFEVLIRGTSGTPFDGLLWDLLDQEVTRVGASYDSLKSTGVCRADVPSEVFGSLVVGAYFLLIQRMSRHERAPDFEHWVEALQRLLREGSLPRTSISTSPRSDRRHRRALSSKRSVS